jgi:OmpA-OmpF porin, OOP family
VREGQTALPLSPSVNHLSGPAGYNQRLSKRRANAVADALPHPGVPSGDTAVSGRGIDNSCVPTALGVREPQNRRVEIVFP